MNVTNNAENNRKVLREKTSTLEKIITDYLDKEPMLDWTDVVDITSNHIDVLETFDVSERIYSVEDTSEFQRCINEANSIGFEEGYSDCEEFYESNEVNLKFFSLWDKNKKIEYLCNLFGLNLYDIEGLKNNLKFVFEQK